MIISCPYSKHHKIVHPPKLNVIRLNENVNLRRNISHSVGSREGWKCVCNCLYSKWGFRNRISIERRSVTSVYYDGKICGCQQSFLTETGIWFKNDGRKVWANVLFLNAIIHWQVIHVNYFFFLFYFSAMPYLHDHGLLRSRYFSTMATWRKTSFLYFLPLFCSVFLKRVAFSGKKFCFAGVLNWWFSAMLVEENKWVSLRWEFNSCSVEILKKIVLSTNKASLSSGWKPAIHCFDVMLIS